MKLSDGSTFRFNDNSEAVLRALYQKAEVVLEKIGIHLEGEAKEELENTPRRIDTGLLRNSITHAVSGKPPAIGSYSGEKPSRFDKSNTAIPTGSYSGTAPEDPEDQKAVYIGTNVKYAIYVHEGTSRMTPNRFLKNACMRNEKQIQAFIQNEMKS